MARTVALSIALVLALAACGPSERADVETTSAAAAPDFTLELGEGGTFTLSEESRPVFMVFWAEW